MSIPVLPPSAPFSSEQRAWLNGFFAAVFNADNGSANAQNSISSTRFGTPAIGTPAIGTPAIGTPAIGTETVSAQSETQSEIAVGEEETPWHDPALSLDERLEMARDKPLKLQLMAAMAQLDCGQCGYLCHSYAEAIADGSEKSLRKCVPGEKPTANKLKELMAA